LLQALVAAFSNLGRWPKKKRSKYIWKKKQNSYQNIDELFVKTLKTFGERESYKGQRVAKCLEVPLPLTPSDNGSCGIQK